MKPSLLFGAVFLVLSGFVVLDPQAGDGTYEGLVKEILATVDQLTKTLKTVKDRDSAEAARPELRKAAKRMLDLRKKADEWKQPNKDQKDRLEKEYAPKLEAAVKELREVAAIVKSIPGGEEAVEELAVLKDKQEKAKDKDKDKDKDKR
jgi:septal ring factor EnvC (AmiA/AmiB activator)